MRTLFGSLTDPSFVSERPDAAAADLLGRVAFLWAGAVLHVRASCAYIALPFITLLVSEAVPVSGVLQVLCLPASLMLGMP